MNQRSLSVLTLAAAAFSLAGCANPSQKNAKADDANYEWVTPLGSNVPVRVLKGQTAQTSSPTGTMTADQTAQAIHGAGSPTPKGAN